MYQGNKINDFPGICEIRAVGAGLAPAQKESFTINGQPQGLPLHTTSINFNHTFN
jgi:hypothetical protein